jgi:hypothetical protein
MQPQPPSLLLELPGELRNRIYDYVLTETVPLYCYPSRNVAGTFNLFRRKRLSSMDKGVNQMKYACRQLHQETARLGLTLNPRLIFPYQFRTGTPASVTCAHFLDSLAAQQKNELNVIVVEEQVPDRVRSFYKQFFDLHGIAMLAKFAEEHPNVRVEVKLECFTNRPSGTIIPDIGCIVQLAIRGDLVWPHLYYLKAMVRSAVEKIVRFWRKSGFMIPPFPENLRVFPDGAFEDAGWEAHLMFRNAGSAYQTNVERFYTDGI